MTNLQTRRTLACGSCLSRFFIIAAASLAIQFGGSWSPSSCYGQFAFQQRAVGGIAIGPDGVIDNANVEDQGKLSAERRKMMHNPPAGLNGLVPLRKISLRALEASAQEALFAHKPVPEAVALLGGLQAIHFVFVYPEQKDIVLVGPAEGWRVDARGNFVGVTTGRPVMLLDDLVVALRSAASAARTGITCSIDPSKEGLEQLRSYSAKLKTMGNPEVITSGIEQALGRQQVSFTGVPATSHFAAVLVGADYRMKRLAMNFDKSPVDGFTSFLQMLSGSGHGMSNMMQRWWLEPRYESITRDADGLSWEFKGASVKCMTEEEYAAVDGDRKHQGKVNPLAQKWADNMTKHYDELSLAEPVFGELRNCMDLALAATLIVHGDLTEKANCPLDLFLKDGALKTVEFTAPSQVDSRVSMLKKGRNWVISASGGVSIVPTAYLAKARESEAVHATRSKAAPVDGKAWFWN
jgi:hypothetical protein